MNKIAIATLLAVLVGATSLLSACNTMKGAGEDIERAGEGVQDAAG
ncbi:entericidin A/B family lipoprotein [Salinisphaera sp. T31B1]